MRRIVWKFGLAAGAVIAATMAVSIALQRRGAIDMSTGDVIGYTSMVLAFVLVFFGIRAYRDEVAGGAIGFGRATKVGLLITLVASAAYVATWQVVYWGFYPDFLEFYGAQRLASMQADGATPAALEAARAELERFAALYRNPLFNIAITFLEVLPVGVVMTLVSAGILRRRPGRERGAALAA